MNERRIDAIRRRRKALCNPYAYSEELDELTETRRDRKRLEDPYAHLETLEQFDSSVVRFDGLKAAPRLEIQRRSTYTDSEIEAAARRVQVELLKLAREQSPDVDPLSVLSPAKALELFGFSFAVADSLDHYAAPGARGTVAGIIDRDSFLVKISGQYPLTTKNFTAAHELGHAVLHTGTGLHRDKPLDGVARTRDRTEYEADRFATHFLMPRKLVVSMFEFRFERTPFVLTNSFALELFSEKAQERLRRGIALRELTRVLASSTRFFGRQFSSLAEQFGVSVEAMAIRMEELRVVWMPSDRSDEN